MQYSVAGRELEDDLGI